MFSGSGMKLVILPCGLSKASMEKSPMVKASMVKASPSATTVYSELMCSPSSAGP